MRFGNLARGATARGPHLQMGLVGMEVDQLLSRVRGKGRRPHPEPSLPLVAGPTFLFRLVCVMM